MVFKNKLFFSSKKSDSSPDGSSSPRSIGSNSPSRSDKKKPKSNSKEGTQMPTTSGFSGVACKLTQVRDGMKKKEVVSKLKDTGIQPQPSVNPSVTALKNKNQGTSESKEGPTSVSPILASSLGLNRIKTRSGPLPQESFFSIRGDKGPVAALGSSNLSRPDGGDGGLKSVSNSTKLWAGCGVKNKEDGSTKMGFQENIRGSGLGNSGRNLNDMSSGSRLSREQSPNMQPRSRLQKGELSSESV